MLKHSRRVRALFTSFVVRSALATFAALSACTGGGDGSTSPPNLPTVHSVTVSPGTATLRLGETIMLGAQVAVSNSAATSVTWTSEQSAVASVSNLGAVSALAPGTATIRATSTADGSRSGTATITVQSGRTLTLTPASVSVGVGQQVAMGVVLQVEPGLPTTVTWQSSAADIASVDQNGMITGVAQGATQITAIAVADSTLRASATVTVTQRVRSVVVTPGSTTLHPTQTLRFAATVDAEAGVPQTVTWRSANAAVATVTSDGLVTAIGRGTTTLTAISTVDTLQRGTATVTVSPRLATEWRAAHLQGALFEDVLSIHAVDANTVYAVNSLGDIFRWDGQTWSVSTTGATHATRFVAVHGSSATDIIAVGLGGRIVRFNGTSWTTMASGTTHDLLSVQVEHAGSAWAVGASGVVLQLSDNAWTTQDAGTPQDLLDVWAGDNVVYVVGNSGAVQRRVGGTWSSVDMPTSEPFSGVHGTSANDVVIVGREGSVLRWDGTLWTTINTGIFPGGFRCHRQHGQWRPTLRRG